MAINKNKIFPLTPNLTLIAAGKVLDKRTGSVINIAPGSPSYNTTLVQNTIQEIVSYFSGSHISIANLSSQADVVTSVDSQVIEFYLKTSDGRIDPKEGFLIEVYDSGSDGRLTRLLQENLEDPIDNNNILQDGFSNYFKIDVD